MTPQRVRVKEKDSVAVQHSGSRHKLPGRPETRGVPGHFHCTVRNGRCCSLEFEALAEQDFPVSLTGFDEEELTRLVAELEQSGLTDPDEAPQPEPQVISAPGDVWRLGPHRLFCADATNPDNLRSVLDPLQLLETRGIDRRYRVRARVRDVEPRSTEQQGDKSNQHRIRKLE